jgi:hypothetical protein
VNGAVVNIGGSDLATTFVDSASLVGITPAHVSGAADVVVSNPDAQTAALVNGFTYTAIILPAPTGLVAQSSNAVVNLSWMTTSEASGYNVKRSMTNGGPYSALGVTAGTNFVDTLVTNGVWYYYVVSATNGLGQSADSVEAAAMPLLPLTVPAFDDGAMSMSSNMPTISFATMAGYKYRIVFTDSLTNSHNSWIPILPPMPDGWSNASGPFMSISDTNTVIMPNRFYRIEAASP